MHSKESSSLEDKVSEYLDTIAFVYCHRRNEACDLHLQAGAVDQLTRGHQIFKDKACLGALVDSYGIQLSFHLHTQHHLSPQYPAESNRAC
jgi:hypothetical protein